MRADLEIGQSSRAHASGVIRERLGGQTPDQTTYLRILHLPLTLWPWTNHLDLCLRSLICIMGITIVYSISCNTYLTALKMR